MTSAAKHYLRSRIDSKLQLGFLSIVYTQSLQEKWGEPGSSTSTERVEHEKTWKEYELSIIYGLCSGMDTTGGFKTQESTYALSLIVPQWISLRDNEITLCSLHSALAPLLLKVPSYQLLPTVHPPWRPVQLSASFLILSRTLSIASLPTV